MTISKYSVLRRRARKDLKGNMFPLIRSLLFITLLPVSLELPFSYVLKSNSITSTAVMVAVEVLISLMVEILTFGYTMMHMKVARKEPYGPQDIFYCFQYNSKHYLSGSFVRMIPMFLARIPAYISVLIYMISFESLSQELSMQILGLMILSGILCILVETILGIYSFVLLDDEDLPVWDVIKKSFHLMKGHYIQLLGLYISFAGWEILVFFTFYLANLWVKPYLIQTKMEFYQELIGEKHIY